jgi:hypothetical protein
MAFITEIKYASTEVCGTIARAVENNVQGKNVLIR